MTALGASLRPRWSLRPGALSLATRFALAGGVVLLVAALAIGGFLSRQIEASVVRSSAAASAMAMEAIISPIGQSLAIDGRLSPAAHQALEELFATPPLSERVLTHKVWGPDGQVIHAADDSLEARGLPVTASLARAYSGAVVAEFDRPGAAGAAARLSIHAPIREDWSGRVIGVIEFEEVADRLAADLAQARLTAWATVIAVGLGLGSVLYLIVRGGSRTIEGQRRALDERLSELQALSDRNTDLRLRVQGAAGRTSAAAEEAMRRIGADLHDGPAQTLAYAALRLDALADAVPAEKADDLDCLREAVAAALDEVRAISRGLGLPDIADRPAADIVRAAVEAHCVRSGTPVDFCAAPCLPAPEGEAARICLYRFTQEALANATRHGGGRQVAVELGAEAGDLVLAVRDRGPGPGAAAPGLGLVGLRNRVESLGGDFRLGPRPGGGTEVSMRLPAGGTR